MLTLAMLLTCSRSVTFTALGAAAGSALTSFFMCSSPSSPFVSGSISQPASMPPSHDHTQRSCPSNNQSHSNSFENRRMHLSRLLASAPDERTNKNDTRLREIPNAGEKPFPPNCPSGEPDMSGFLQLMLVFGQLKTEKRTGWIHHNVETPESVADHMYRMSLMSLVTTDDPAAQVRRIKMALVHDMAEALVGDITPRCGIEKAEKSRRERTSMQMITALVPNKKIGNEMLALWEEYEAGKSDDARFLKDLDKFEMIIQAFEYEKAEGRYGALESFFESTKGKIRDPALQQWAAELRSARLPRTDKGS
eukprot:m.62774 g.62774  ORF g.62774 m.62774 type:complete len:308 (+) comp19399_c0_seq1:69-992(+)